MKSLEYELRYLQGGADRLEQYLLSDDVFWPLNVDALEGEPEYPRLTLGGLLLASAKLNAYSQSDSQKYQVAQVISDLDTIRSKWRVAWEKKASREFSMRLRMWHDYLDEYQNNPQEHADRYRYEVRLRVMLQLLAVEFEQKEQTEIELWHMLDSYLKGVLIAGGFIWEAEIRSAFSADPYWYLYGRLSSTTGRSVKR